MKRPAIILDRDGTIIVERDYLADPDSVEIEDNVPDGLILLAAAGFALVVISNQSGVGRGYFDTAAVEAVNARTQSLLSRCGVSIEQWYYCPHAPSAHCDCRKPRPGLALQAARELDLDLSLSWVIGDKKSDIMLAEAIGARGALVTTGHGHEALNWALEAGIPVYPDIAELAHFIISKSLE